MRRDSKTTSPAEVVEARTEVEAERHSVAFGFSPGGAKPHRPRPPCRCQFDLILQ